jgi:chemotaxis protein methyltransferase WspC
MTHIAVRRWLEEHALVEPSLLDNAGIDTVVAERIAAFGGSEPAYIEALARSPDEVDLLMAGIAVPETWLFRYRHSYDLLLEVLERRRASGQPMLRMLSIGCATGQEPYCMAMTALQAGWPAERVSVEGLDRNSGFLRTAAMGEYGPSSIRSDIPAWAVPFLQRHGEAIAIATPVRDLVRFTKADVTDPVSLRGAGPFHVIFCRNLLIYLNAHARSSLLDSICAELAPEGLLFVGHAEQVMRGRSPLRLVASPHAFALEKYESVSLPEAPPVSASRSPARPVPPQGRRAAPALPKPPAVLRPDPLPTSEDSLEVARGLADAGRMEDAEAMIRAVIARSGPSADANELLGMIRLSVNDTPGAKRLFEQVVYLDPARATSLLQLAIISERAGEKRRADAYWDRARRTSAAAPQEHQR